MSKFYFYDEGDEYCVTLDNIKDKISDDDLKEKEVFKAKPLYGEGLFYCKVVGEVGSVGDSGCGKDCSDYKPRNGKNGRCIHSGLVYEFGDPITIKV